MNNRKRNEAIFNQISTESMPPGEPWRKDKLRTFSNWISDGMPKRKPSSLSALERIKGL